MSLGHRSYAFPDKRTACDDPVTRSSLTGGLVSGIIRRILVAAQFNAGDQNTSLVDMRAVPASASGNFDPNAGFTAIPASALGGGQNLIVFNMANFWQYSMPEMLGTMLHEYAHILRPTLGDTDVQKALGVTVDPSDHSDISIKLADDCFGGASLPTAQ